MCDFGLVLGMTAGASQLAAQASAASANRKTTLQRHRIDESLAAREMLADTQVANKEGYQAVLEGDRAKSLAVASGAGMTGAVPGLRAAEQSRQTALTIANAKDRANGAKATYAAQSEVNRVSAENAIAKQSLSPMSAFLDIATSGLSNYGAFK